jgi:hypothetical protein
MIRMNVNGFVQADLKRREQIAAGRARPGRPAAESASSAGAIAQIPPSVAATLGPPLGLPRTAAAQVSIIRIALEFGACAVMCSPACHAQAYICQFSAKFIVYVIQGCVATTLGSETVAESLSLWRRQSFLLKTGGDHNCGRRLCWNAPCAITSFWGCAGGTVER